MPSTADHLVSQYLALPSRLAAPAVYLAVSFAIALGLWHLLVARPPLPKKAPRAWSGHDWPIVGSAISFYSRRRDMVVEGMQAAHGSFSFFIGKKHVVALAGVEGRKTFYESKDLNFSAGFVELLAGMPFTQEAEAREGDWPRYFNKTIVTLLRQENLERRVPQLSRDVRALCDRLVAATPSTLHPEWRVTDAFDGIYDLHFQMLSRVVGATEVSDDPKLARRMLSVFETFENSNSTLGIVFPWLRVVTPSYLLRIALGAVLYASFNKIIQERKRTGRREDDALQYLLDQDTNLDVIIKFQISAVWAALITTGANGTWLLVFLAAHPAWKARCAAEIDAAVARHRAAPGQSARDVLDTLALAHWEAEFPVVHACLAEAIRLALPGAVFRRNTSRADVAIGATGRVIPPGAFAAYLTDEVHMDPALYGPDPERFEPARHLPGQAEGERVRAVPHGYVGWGTGRHPCLGTRLAKLQITLVLAYFMAGFEYELADKHGNPTSEMPPLPDRNQHKAERAKTPVYLRYRPRC